MKKRTVIAVVLAAACLTVGSACKADGKRDEMEAWSGAKQIEDGYAETYSPNEECSLINPPTVVHEITSKATMDALNSGSWKPSNVIVHFSKNYNVVDTDGYKLDSFASFYTTKLKGKMIPVLYLEDEECAEAAVTFLTERMEIYDMAVMSESAAAVKKVRDAFPVVRGILDCTAETSVTGLAMNANECKAGTVVLSQKTATAENVSYIQARFKTVWVRTERDDAVSYYDSIGSGAYGVIASDFNKLYNTLCDGYLKGAVRSPFNVGHRGLSQTYNHNSMSGVRAACAMGATHVEVDGWLTKDNEIIIMHNKELNATADGTIDDKVTEMTLEEIKRHKLNRHGIEEIPTLNQIIDVMKEEGNDSVLIFEVKDGRNEIIDKMKAIVEEKQFEERFVVISFARNIVETMATKMPRIPTASLANSMSSATIPALTQLNAGIDVEKASMTKEFENYAKARGYIGWYWTFSNQTMMGESALEGYLGLTSDTADKFTQSAGEYSLAYLKPLASYDTVDAIEEGNAIALKKIAYDGTEIDVEGTVRFVQDLGDRYAVMASCKKVADAPFSPVFYTQIFYIPKK